MYKIGFLETSALTRHCSNTEFKDISSSYIYEKVIPKVLDIEPLEISNYTNSEEFYSKYPILVEDSEKRYNIRASILKEIFLNYFNHICNITMIINPKLYEMYIHGVLGTDILDEANFDISAKFYDKFNMTELIEASKYIPYSLINDEFPVTSLFLNPFALRIITDNDFEYRLFIFGNDNEEELTKFFNRDISFEDLIVEFNYYQDLRITKILSYDIPNDSFKIIQNG